MIRVRLAGFPFCTVLAGVFSIGGLHHQCGSRLGRSLILHPGHQSVLSSAVQSRSFPDQKYWTLTGKSEHYNNGSVPVFCPCTNILTAEVQDGFGLPFFCWLSRLHSAALKATERLLAMFNPRRC